jgi:hypothetical protein
MISQYSLPQRWQVQRTPLRQADCPSTQADAGDSDIPKTLNAIADNKTLFMPSSSPIELYNKVFDGQRTELPAWISAFFDTFEKLA